MNTARSKLIMVSVGLILSLPAYSLELNTVRKELAKKPHSHTWSAVEPSDNVRKMAATSAEPKTASFSAPETLTPSTGANLYGKIPDYWDWRDKDGVNYMSSVDIPQGECGSCVAFATVSALEGSLNYRCQMEYPDVQLSRQYFFSCGGGSCQKGWKLSEAIRFLENSGVPDAPCMPYISGDGRLDACSNACSDANDRKVERFKAIAVTKGFIDVKAIKAALMQGPLIANMILYEDLQYYQRGIYKHVSGLKLGSHAITLVGWDDSKKAWLVRNSWGERWGLGGYFWAAFDDPKVLLGRYTWQIDSAGVNLDKVCHRF